MEISDEQIEEFKKQIINQIQSTFPEDRKNSAIENVNSMSKEEFIDFLKRNNLIATSEDSNSEFTEIKNFETKESPFRLIIEGKIPAYLIEENKQAVAVLEIRPVSKAHAIIISKKPLTETDKIPKTLFTLAKRIASRIKEKFNPKEVAISSSLTLGEIIINILPVYSNESLSSQRNTASKEELESIKSMLEKKKKEKVVSLKPAKVKKLDDTKMWIPRRIP